jgi:hypothetical protein
MTNRGPCDVRSIEIEPPSLLVDPRNFVMSYDGDMDTLMLYFFDRGRPAISVVLADSSYALVDPDTHTLIGFQIEDFSTEFVRAHPELVDVLEFAELRDMSADDVRALRQDVLSYPGRLKSWLWRVMWRIRKQPWKLAVAQRLIASEDKRIRGCAIA